MGFRSLKRITMIIPYLWLLLIR